MSNETTDGNIDQTQSKTDDQVNNTERQLQSSFEHSLQISSKETKSSVDPTDQLSTKTTVDPSNSALRSEAREFTPSTRSTTNAAAAAAVAAQPTATNSETKFDMNSSSIFNLKKFRHEFFVSQLKCSFDPENGKFSSPSGLSALPDDRLLVADFTRDCVFLLDLNGVVHKIYPNIKSPKDVLYHSSRSSQFIVALQKELTAIDIETGKRVSTSKLRGFYPWNVQYIPDANIYAACDPSGERIVYLDENFAEIGDTSLKNLFGGPTTMKVYPYAVSYLGRQNAFVLSHYADQCRLNEIGVADSSVIHSFDLPTPMKSYSIYTDSEEKCLIVDETNHRLISIGKTSNFEEYRLKTSLSPYAMTFLSDGTLCVTCRNSSQPSNSGFCVISEEDRRTKQ